MANHAARRKRKEKPTSTYNVEARMKIIQGPPGPCGPAGIRGPAGPPGEINLIMLRSIIRGMIVQELRDYIFVATAEDIQNNTVKLRAIHKSAINSKGWPV